jgi:hypothetical protein
MGDRTLKATNIRRWMAVIFISFGFLMFDPREQNKLH